MSGKVKMIDVSDKQVTEREARACAVLRVKKSTLKAIKQGRVKKGDVIAVSKVAGISAAKKTWELIPMCHPIPLSVVEVEIRFAKEDTIKIESHVKTAAQTGVEMEAIVAVSIAALTVYDMCKGIDPGIRVSDIFLLEKKGGKSGGWVFPDN